MCVEKYVKMMRILFVGHMTDLSYDVDGPEAITGNSHIWDLPGHDPPNGARTRTRDPAYYL